MREIKVDYNTARWLLEAIEAYNQELLAAARKGSKDAQAALHDYPSDAQKALTRFVIATEEDDRLYKQMCLFDDEEV